MFRPIQATQKLFTTALAAALLAATISLPEAEAGEQHRAASRRSRSAAAKPAPTPVVVPRLPAQEGRSAAPAATPQQQKPAGQKPAQAEVDDSIDDDEVVRVTSNLVVVPVSVTDAEGQAVQGLKREDFRLEEEGRAQELAAVGDADQVPLDIALVFDLSSSVVKNFEFEKQAAAGFLRHVLKPADRAAVFTIAEKPEMLHPLGGADAAVAVISSLNPADKSTGTAFYDTVRAAAKYLTANAPERHRRVILVISDGEDNFSDDVRDATIAAFDKTDKGDDPKARLAKVNEQTRVLHQRALQRLMREVQAADAVFYSINPSGPGIRLNLISQRAQNNMQEIATTTGGTAFVPARIEHLEQVFNQITAELRAQYLLQYLSNTQAQPGKFLRIKISTPARPGLRVRARQGYFKKG